MDYTRTSDQMSEKLFGHIEHIERSNGWERRFVFDQPATLSNDDTIVIEWRFTNTEVTAEATISRDVPSSPVEPEWAIEYDNDTGPNDEDFAEWWTISNGKRSFTCKNEDDAEWLCDLLNQYE